MMMKFPTKSIELRPVFKGRFITPEKSEWVKAYPKTGESAYQQWHDFCQAHDQEIKTLPDSFTVSYQLNNGPIDQVSCQFLTDKNEVVEWKTAVQRKGTFNGNHEEVNGFQSQSNGSIKQGYREYFEGQWDFLKAMFLTITTPVHLDNKMTAPNIGHLFWVSPQLITHRKQLSGDWNGYHSIFNQMYNPGAGFSHLKRYELYQKMAIQHHDQLSKLPPGFWLECTETKGKTVSHYEWDKDQTYYLDVISLCRQTYPGGPVQRWEIDSSFPQAVAAYDDGHFENTPASSLEKNLEAFFLRSLDKALALSQTLPSTIKPGEDKDC
jgi:hypothetical protein